MKIHSVLLRIGVLSCLVLVLPNTTRAQESKSQDSCLGLHAGITAQLMQGYGDPSVMVTFHLLNDSETSQSAAPESWQIVIDGKELKDSGWIFGNGPAPVGGYGTLAAGSIFDVVKLLPTAQYFPESREYKISWKGKGFQSPTVTVRILTPKR